MGALTDRGRPAPGFVDISLDTLPGSAGRMQLLEIHLRIE